MPSRDLLSPDRHADLQMELHGVARGQRVLGTALIAAGVAFYIAAAAWIRGPGDDDALVFGSIALVSGWALLFHSIRRRSKYLRRRLSK